MFSEYERQAFRDSCRDYSIIEKLRDAELPDDLILFLKEENHLKRVKDYVILRRFPKVNEAENIIITYFLDSKASVFSFLENWEDFLSPPVIFLWGKNQTVTYYLSLFYMLIVA